MLAALREVNPVALCRANTLLRSWGWMVECAGTRVGRAVCLGGLSLTVRCSASVRPWRASLATGESP
jgi:hypothetical protein